MTTPDFPDWQRSITVITKPTIPVTVTIVPNQQQPPPGPSTAFFDPEPFAWAATPVSGVIVDVGGYVKPVSWSISNPEGNPGVWIMYLDSPAVVGKGIYLPSPGFLFEDTWLGLVSGITAAGNASGGGMVMTVDV